MLRIKLFIIGFIGAAMLFTSCDEDGTGGGIGGGGNADAPFVFIFDDGSGTNLTFDSTVEPGQAFTVQIEATSNVAQLRAVEVLLGGSSLTPDEFDNQQIDDGDEQNPQLLFGADKDAFNWTFGFIAPELEADYTYDFVISDDDGLASTVTINVTVLQTVPDTPPSLTLNGPVVLESLVGTLNSFNITAVAGTNNLASVSVWEDQNLITEDLTRIRFMGVDFESNPLPLFAPESEGFSGSVIIIESIAGNHDYVIRVTDTEGNNADVTFTVEEVMVSTPLDEEFEFILVSNASGPDLGGLDLDNGVAVASASGDAEIRDLGIDTNQPAATNWIQRVEPVNGAMLRVVDTSMLPEGFTFDSVDSKELVAAAFNTGTASDPSPVLQTGDILAVASPNNIYIMQVDEVGVTDNDNNDFYRFSIKW